MEVHYIIFLALGELNLYFYVDGSSQVGDLAQEPVVRATN